MPRSFVGRRADILRCGPRMEAQVQGDLEVESGELRNAIAAGHMVVYYQPKVGLFTGQALGVEALVRWQHPERGLVFPDDFIPAAERSGAMTELTDFVLDQAAGQYARWQANGIDLPVAVNLSASSLVDAALPDKITAVCDRHGISHRGLDLEITETSVMADPKVAIAVLSVLAERGFVMAIDDFGTGFSSLAYLAQLPVSVVKIDKSFVLDVVENNADAHIVRGIIELVHGLGKYVVAEGVESQDALNLLLLMGCDQGQGYHWSRPVPAEELTAWVTKHQQNLTVSDRETGLVPRAPIPANEAERLAVLQRYRILDTAYEAIFDEIAAAAAQVCGTPISAVSLVDAERQWFKARVGLEVAETTRDLAFCAHTIMDPAHLLVVNDATTDERFASNPLVTGEPSIRFYAGAPLVAPDGSAVGSLCVIDSKPRQLSVAQLTVLRQLAAHVIAIFEAKQQLAELTERLETPSQRVLRRAS
jgi:EAL domain-containing protein (putative c-di-GMP-specific phosphodiesterase class I)